MERVKVRDQLAVSTKRKQTWTDLGVRVVSVFKYGLEKKISQSTGFEPVRGDPNGFLVHRLNHSATTAYSDLGLFFS